MKRYYIYVFTAVFAVACSTSKNESNDVPDSISGIYPHLANYNSQGECGTGAVVPWQGDLWVVSYSPHEPFGSDDKLYQITPDMRKIIREESIGGTPANRMIHKPTNQLFIGPYVIDAQKNVRVVSYDKAPGRPTGVAAHLSDPENRVLYASMEAGFYDIDMHSLEVVELYKDGNQKRKEGFKGELCTLFPGYHGKGFYSGQGVAIYSNNGEEGELAQKKFDIPSGCLVEWDGKTWTVVRRNQFTEITGPGGICGNPNPATDPIWAVGWDYKSLLLGVRDAEKGWSYYRLPKASHSYDGAHGWNTEWPRIRDIGTEYAPDYMMTMHGMFWHFPPTFTISNSAGIRPRSAYLKVIADFARWNDHLVFGCDDSAMSEFLNKRSAKGGIEGPGQSNSNVWFTSPTKPDELGPATAEGAVWAKENVNAGALSEPFLFTGWKYRCGWIRNDGKQTVTFSYEVDAAGNGDWKTLKKVSVEAGQSVYVPFTDNESGEWVRVHVDKNTTATVSFSYTSADERKTLPDAIYRGLTKVEDDNSLGGLLYGLGDNRRSLGVLANTTIDGKQVETGYYEMGETLELKRKDDATTADFIRSRFAIPEQVVTIDNSSVLIVDDGNRRWRLPLGNAAYKNLTDKAVLRICREVATERDLFSCMGTFYELPAENADGYAKIRPVASHNFRINDYASYRGMMILTGISPKEVDKNPHVIISDDGKAAVWAGVIDDLWMLGKPVGHGGPWKDAEVKAGVVSDPYLIAFYDKKTLKLSHTCSAPVVFKVEVDPTGNDDWMTYSTFEVKPGDTFKKQLPPEFQARWIRFSTDTDTKATAWLDYE